MSSARIHDLVGIGLGPFNLGLAALSAPVADLDTVFVEAREGFDWHPGLMFEDATLQVPFLADVVSLADPTSPYSFLNWLKQTGRLYPFYIRENFLPHRREYNQYCQWVAGQLEAGGRIRFGFAVTSVSHDGEAYVVTSAAGEQVRGRRLVLGTGTSPYVPACAADAVASQPAGPALHAADHLARRAELVQQESITVVGSGQSAAEVYLDLLTAQPDHGYHLTWVTRSPRFFPMEYTKLTLELTSPEYTAYFQGLPEEQRASLLQDHKQLYKGISSDTVNAIHDLLYARSIEGSPDTTLLTASELTAVAGSTEYRLTFRHTETGDAFALGTGAVVFATGYRPGVPTFLEGVRDRIRLDDRGRYAASSTYDVGVVPGEVFVQNGEEHTHGFVAPDLGMGAYRNSVILNTITGREVYPVEKRIAFQEFGVPDRLRTELAR